MNIVEKKEVAKLLYLTGEHTQKLISEKVDVAEKTMSKWVNEGEWEKLRQAKLITKENVIAKILTEMDDIMSDDNPTFEDENGKIKKKPKKSDEIVKLAKSLSYLQNDKLMLPHVMQTFKMFNSFCEGLTNEMREDIVKEMLVSKSLVKPLYKLQNIFIQENSKKLMY